MKNNPMILFPGESEEELSAGLLRSLAIGILVMSFIFILLASLALQHLILRALIIGGSAMLICSCILWLIRRSQVRIAGIVLIAFLWLIVSLGTFTAGGLSAPIFFGYAAVILIGAVLFGSAAGLMIAIFSIGFGWFAVYAGINNFLPPPSTDYSPAARLAIYAFFFFVILLLQKTAVDTTKRAILRAHVSESQYRSFLENIPTVTYIKGLLSDPLITYVSPQVEKLLGYTQNEFLQDPSLWKKIILPADQADAVSWHTRMTESGQPLTLEYRLVSKSEKIIWVRDEVLLVRNKEGAPEYWLGVWTDITERKISEKTREDAVKILTTRTAQLMTASEVSSAASSILELDELLSKVVMLIRSHFDYYYVGIFLVDEKHENAFLRAATGESGKQMLALKHSLPIGNSSMVGWCVANNQARIALDVGKDTVRFKNPFLPLSRSELALPLRARGRVIGAMTIQSEKEAAFTDADIKALQTMADQVANAIETARLFDERAGLIKELEEKNTELERFTYTVSHDLKSPLVTIRGYLGYLRSDAEKGDFSRFDKDITRIIKAADTMQTLLNDLLDLSRVGRIINPSETVAFEELVKDALNLTLPPWMAEKIKIEIQPSLPIVRCDRTRVIEVLQNLLSNAAKFMGSQPNPAISIGSNGFDGESGLPVFFVKDNGIGIDAKYHEQVFGLFNRLNPEQEGTGIGLTLVKRIIEVHGGRIWLESEGHGKGSIFYFTLPAA